ncbi:MAG: hypothetical protein F6J93_21150 [Oscillatoria sp. SIO1A7]|nr:hypothetical protein [Oscillatoria sp. SIO1A7]
MPPTPDHYQEGKKVAQCPMPNSQFPMPNAQCPIPNAQFPIQNPQNPDYLLEQTAILPNIRQLPSRE